MEKGCVPLTKVSYDAMVKERDRNGYVAMKVSKSGETYEESRAFERRLAEGIRMAGGSWLPITFEKDGIAEKVFIAYPINIVKKEWHPEPRKFLDDMIGLASEYDLGNIVVKEMGCFPRVVDCREAQPDYIEILCDHKEDDIYGEVVSILSSWLGTSAEGKELYLVYQPQSVMGAHSRHCQREMIVLGDLPYKTKKKKQIPLDGNAYSSGKYLFRAMERIAETPFGVTEPGGTLVFSSDVIGIKNSKKHIAVHMKRTLPNPYAASWKRDMGIKGKFVREDKTFDENSIVLDIVGVTATELEQIATEFSDMFRSGAIIVKSYKPEDLYILYFE